MHIERVPNRNSPPAVLLRQSYREDEKIRKRTLANLSKLPMMLLKDCEFYSKVVVRSPVRESAFDIQRSLRHGHVAAVLGTLKNIG